LKQRNGTAIEFIKYERGRRKILGQREKDNVLLNLVDYRAQEVILHTALPEEKKY
jgi:hypothetical protein